MHGAVMFVNLKKAMCGQAACSGRQHRLPAAAGEEPGDRQGTSSDCLHGTIPTGEGEASGTGGRSRPRCKGLCCDGSNWHGFTCKGFNCNGFNCKGFKCNGVKCNGIKRNSAKCNGIRCNGVKCNGFHCNINGAF